MPHRCCLVLVYWEEVVAPLRARGLISFKEKKRERERKEKAEEAYTAAELVASHAFNKVTQYSLAITTKVALFDQDYKDARASNNPCVVSIGSYSTSRPDTFSLYFFLQPFTPDRHLIFGSLSLSSLFF